MNEKRIITNILLTLLPILILVLLSQPYFNALTGISALDKIQSGYGMVSSAKEGALVCNAVTIIIAAVSAGLLILLALFGLLRCTNVIRFEKLDKAVVWLKMIVVTLLFLSTAISLICLGYQCGQKFELDPYNYSIGWAAIVNLATSCLIVTVYLIERIKIQSKNASKKASSKQRKK